MIVAVARFQVPPEHVDEFVGAARDVIAATTEKEPGCTAYDCSRDVLDGSQFVFVEEWADMTAIGAHVQSEHYAAFKAVTDRVLTGQSVTLHTVEKSRTL